MTRGAGWATVLSRRASVRWLWPRGWRDPGRKATVLVRFGAAEICFLARIIGRIAGSFHGLVPRVSWKPSKFRIRRYLKPVHLSSRGCAFRFAGQIVRRAARESARPTFGGPVQRPTRSLFLFLSSPPSLRSRTPPRETVRQRAHPHMLAATSTPPARCFARLSFARSSAALPARPRPRPRSLSRRGARVARRALMLRRVRRRPHRHHGRPHQSQRGQGRAQADDRPPAPQGHARLSPRGDARAQLALRPLPRGGARLRLRRVRRPRARDRGLVRAQGWRGDHSAALQLRGQGRRPAASPSDAELTTVPHQSQGSFARTRDFPPEEMRVRNSSSRARAFGPEVRRRAEDLYPAGMAMVRRPVSAGATSA